MKLKPIVIGGVTIRNNLFLAPLAGYTNYPFRRICERSGAGLAFTEMVSAKGLKYGSENTRALLYTTEEESPCAVQLFGSEPDVMRAACESAELSPFPVVDINMGCPVPKIYKNGEGSALLENPPLAEKIVSECVRSGKAVTVKMRIGVSADKLVSAEFAKRMEGAGAALVTVHGRTRDKYYSGEVNAAEIAAVKRSVKIPVIANGGVFSVADADRLLDETGADGVMIARAALSDPQIFCDFTGMPRRSKREVILTQLAETKELFGERFATVYMRKMAALYLKGEKGAAAARERLFRCPDTSSVAAAVREIFP